MEGKETNANRKVVQESAPNPSLGSRGSSDLLEKLYKSGLLHSSVHPIYVNLRVHKLIV